MKPWDDETDMVELERQVREIETDGLLWGAGKLVAVGYGIKKLQICCVVEDDKVGTDFLEEQITNLEDLVSLKKLKRNLLFKYFFYFFDKKFPGQRFFKPFFLFRRLRKFFLIFFENR